MIPDASTIVSGVFYVAGMCLIRYWLGSLGQKIDSMVSRDDCQKDQRAICKKIEKENETNKDQWQVINHHGHKGLQGDENLVVRTS